MPCWKFRKKELSEQPNNEQPLCLSTFNEINFFASINKTHVVFFPFLKHVPEIIMETIILWIREFLSQWNWEKFEHQCRRYEYTVVDSDNTHFPDFSRRIVSKMSFYNVYTTVSMKDALEAKERGALGADFLMTCAQTPVYSLPASVFFAHTKTAAAPSVTITVTPAPLAKPERKIPTLEEFNALPKDQMGHWECLHCCAPALAGAYIPGSYCSQTCAYYGYL